MMKLITKSEKTKPHLSNTHPHRIASAAPVKLPALALLFLGPPIYLRLASLGSCNNHSLHLIHTLFLFLSRLSHKASS